MLIIMIGLLSLLACNNSATNTQQQAHKNNPFEITVVTHNGPTTYYVDGHNEFSGFEYELAKLFVAYLGPEYTIKFLPVDHISKVVPALIKGEATFAAADLSVTHIRQQLVVFTVPYRQTQQVIVYNKETTKKPKTPADLIGKQIAVPVGTSYAERLGKLSNTYPEIDWMEVSNASTDELLEQVAENLLDLTIADEHVVQLLENFYPNLDEGFAIGDPEPIAWAFPKNGNPYLLSQANKFFAQIKTDGTLRNLVDKYYGHSQRLETADVTQFLKRTHSLLPQYKGLFKEAQAITGIDWRLLAAISYRESHWDKLNTSPTNVRGLMMLTEDTADKMGVTDRLDPRQSIMGGAKYIAELRDMIPERIPEPDRTWMALAAYNIGMAHMEDARVLAQRLKLNPDNWADVKKALPLLNKQEYYGKLKYGYASGGAPVIFVESIRSYQQILDRLMPDHDPMMLSQTSE